MILHGVFVADGLYIIRTAKSRGIYTFLTRPRRRWFRKPDAVCHAWIRPRKLWKVDVLRATTNDRPINARGANSGPARIDEQVYSRQRIADNALAATARRSIGRASVRGSGVGGGRACRLRALLHLGWLSLEESRHGEYK